MARRLKRNNIRLKTNKQTIAFKLYASRNIMIIIIITIWLLLCSLFLSNFVEMVEIRAKQNKFKFSILYSAATT
jgi:hypothetical protein